MGARENARKRRETALLRTTGTNRAVAVNRATHTKADDIAATAALPISQARGQDVTITGTATITSATETAEGTITRVVFQSTGSVLTHNGTSLILPTAANITTEAGDTAEFQSLGDGNYRVRSYQRASGAAISGITGGGTAGNITYWVSSQVLGDLSGFQYDGVTNGIEIVPPFSAAGGSNLYVENAADGAIGITGLASGDAGSAIGVVGQTESVDSGAYGVFGIANASTGTGIGVIGQTASSNNASYGGRFICSGTNHVGLLCDGADFVVEVAPDTPPSGHSRLYALTSAGYLYYKLPAGTVVGPLGATFDVFTADDIAFGDLMLFGDVGSSNETNSVTISKLLGFASASICEGRLTLTSGTARTTADVTGATSVYFALDTGDRITIYDGTRLRLYQFTELTLALGTLTADLPYDVFIYDNSGTLTLESLAWTNGTTRATALVRQNGAWYKTGALTRRYLGTFYTTSTTTTEDSAAKRFLFNAHNRVEKAMSVVDATNTWTWSTASYQQANASTANQLEVLRGLNEDRMVVHVRAAAITSGATQRAVRTGIGLDSTTVNSATIYEQVTIDNAKNWPSGADYVGFPGLGYHYLAWLEYGGGADTQTWQGDSGGTRQTGMVGSVYC